VAALVSASQEAFNKDAKNPDTLSNLITVGLHLAKNVARYQTWVQRPTPWPRVLVRCLPAWHVLGPP
jgi:hypothetical protein